MTRPSPDTPPVRAAPFHGLDAVHLALPSGGRAVVALQGAQVLSWSTADGVERLYLSPRAVFDGHRAIRGGVPICFPQFNQRGPLAKHGFARNLAWALERSQAGGDCVQAVFVLADTAQTRAWWPHAFTARLNVLLAPGSLRLELSVHNSGATAWDCTAALHTYLRVEDIARVRLDGLDGCARWDAVQDARGLQSGAVAFAGEYDSVFAAAPALLQLRGDGVHSLDVAQGPSWSNTVVWNPGASRCAALPDMPDDGFQHMLCVEAACVEAPVHLAPGDAWAGWQHLRAV